MTRKIYGVSSKYEFGKWHHVVSVFDDKEKAEAWLHTEQHDFRERELMTKTAAIKLAGTKAVENAIQEGKIMITREQVLENLRTLIGQKFDPAEIVTAFEDFEESGETQIIVKQSENSGYDALAYIDHADATMFLFDLKGDMLENVRMY